MEELGSPVYEETDICISCGEHCALEDEDDLEETCGAMDRF